MIIYLVFYVQLWSLLFAQVRFVQMPREFELYFPSRNINKWIIVQLVAHSLFHMKNGTVVVL